MQNSLSNGIKKLCLPLLLTTAMIIGNGEISKIFGQKNKDIITKEDRKEITEGIYMEFNKALSSNQDSNSLYYENGNIKYKKNKNDDGKIQTIEYHENGNKKAEFIELPNGDIKSIGWDENGNKYIEGYYNKDLEKIGIWKYWDENGNKNEEINYDNNHITTWDTDGSKLCEGDMVDDKKEGKRIIYYSTGGKSSEGYFKHDKESGERIYYDKNGKINIKGQYIDGKKTGTRTYWDGGKSRQSVKH